jgi:hypothetical protein
MTCTAARRGSVWAVSVAVCCVALGCTQSRSSRQEVRLLASAKPYEADIPIPTGFKLVDEASEDRSTGMSRLYLRHLYRGQADKYAVRGFYREQMPLARWVKVSDGNVAGRISLRFEKGNESCTIDIREVPGHMRSTTEIQVLVTQEQGGSGTGGSAIRRNNT